MPRPPTLARSDSTMTAGPPSDAAEPDDKAISDVYRSVEETGSLELAAKKLQMYATKQQEEKDNKSKQQKMRQMWADDPEEAGYMAQAHAEDMTEDGEERVDQEEREIMQEEVVHLQEVLPGLWIGDLVAAMDTKGMQERGITNVLSLLRPRLAFDKDLAVYPLEIDDAADTDILTHLPSCVAWIQEALDKRQRALDPVGSPLALDDSGRSAVIDPIAGETKPGGVLVHCQAGMSRSATVVSAYLIQTLDLGVVEAVEMLRDKRPVIDPSETFWYQLGLFWNADGRVSLKDRSTRQFYMERTTSQFMNGEGGAPSMEKMAKFPATPSDSTPPTPMGGLGRRKIRCRQCRRHLAVREHMMDHILDQSPVSRPRTPSNFALPSPRSSLSQSSANEPIPISERERRTSIVSDVINPLTGLPGRQTRHASVSAPIPPPIDSDAGQTNGHHSQSDPSPVTPGAIPHPRKNTAPGLTLTSSSPDAPTAPRMISDLLPGRETTKSPMTSSSVHHKQSSDSLASSATGQISNSAPNSSGPRQLRSAADINSSLPPHLLALRTAGGGSISNLSSPFNTSPASSPEKETSPQMPHHAFPPASQVVGVTQSRKRSESAGSNSGTIGRRMSLLAMTPKAGGANGEGSIAASGPPILVNPKCSGYFVEPLTWMEPFLKKGEVSGKIVCPNEKCGAKIGNYDWAGVQCGCKEWVTPGFCISRSKVDEVW